LAGHAAARLCLAKQQKKASQGALLKGT
jgi:hypothetical protein